MAEASFADDIEWFVRQIESRKRLLPTFTHASLILSQKIEGDYDTFIDEHGVDIVKEGDKITEFNIPSEHSHSYSYLLKALSHTLIFTDLLPKMTLVSLVSVFDSYLAKLIKSFYSARPEALNSSERQIKLSELLTYDDIEEAKDYILSSEIESVLRSSHTDQFKWLENKLQINELRKLDAWGEFIEITERRNLFVHADGVINRQYLNICKSSDEGCDGNLTVGDKLGVSPEYYDRACDVIAEVGVKLGQIMWRKLLTNELIEADESLITCVYDLLVGRDYSLALTISEISKPKAFKFGSDQNKYYLLINQAIALKGLKREDEVNKLIGKIDFSALAFMFQLANFALSNDWENAALMMKKIGPDGDVTKSDYHNWPLFRWFRKTDEFKTAYEEVFGEEFKISGKIWDHEKEDAQNPLTGEPEAEE
ncbi:hypothetical protein BM523_08135 [Alteromonas mediterranea]|uniref:hypothetical protein n=1 Tax=Alteromonas mediterranea TaxID=314275 RepID=UPI0009044D06|nr:hypothetical protein [Alteromonas mediterranea]APD93958.1 hypothetical protein BM523_08135 [Alteromonas mediterranea]APD97585.1 hypothetical protein BM525_08170 [Alteromonas mediterranea]